MAGSRTGAALLALPGNRRGHRHRRRDVAPLPCGATPAHAGRVSGQSALTTTPATLDTRAQWVDTLRVVLIAGVIVVHTATGYVTDIVGWYYDDELQPSTPSATRQPGRGHDLVHPGWLGGHGSLEAGEQDVQAEFEFGCAVVVC
jgi:hypothetical protein